MDISVELEAGQQQMSHNAIEMNVKATSKRYKHVQQQGFKNKKLNKTAKSNINTNATPICYI